MNGTDIRRRRAALHISQGVLASLAEISPSALCMHELGQTRLSSEAERRVFQILAALERVASSFPGVRVDFRDVLATRQLLQNRPGLLTQSSAL